MQIFIHSEWSVDNKVMTLQYNPFVSIAHVTVSAIFYTKHSPYPGLVTCNHWSLIRHFHPVLGIFIKHPQLHRFIVYSILVQATILSLRGKSKKVRRMFQMLQYRTFNSLKNKTAILGCLIKNHLWIFKTC